MIMRCGRRNDTNDLRQGVGLRVEGERGSARERERERERESASAHKTAKELERKREKERERESDTNDLLDGAGLRVVSGAACLRV